MRTTTTAIATRTAPRTSQRVRLQPARPCGCSRYVLIPLSTRLAPQGFHRSPFSYAFLTHERRSVSEFGPKVFSGSSFPRFAGQQRVSLAETEDGGQTRFRFPSASHPSGYPEHGFSGDAWRPASVPREKVDRENNPPRNLTRPARHPSPQMGLARPRPSADPRRQRR